MSASQANTPLGRPDNGQKIVLALVAVGLAVILAAALVYRFSGGSLVKQTGLPVASSASSGLAATAPPISPGQMPGQMSGEIPQAMLDALAAQGMSLSDIGMSESPAPSDLDLSMPVVTADDMDQVLDLAEMFTSLGDFANAQNFVNQALVASPSDPRPYYQQARIYQAQEQYQQAAQMMERSLALGDSAQVRHDLAQIYATGLNDKTRAAEHLNAAMAMPELDPNLRAHYQEELEALGLAPAGEPAVEPSAR